MEFQQQHHSNKNEHDAHLPTKHPQSTPLLWRGDEHTQEEKRSETNVCKEVYRRGGVTSALLWVGVEYLLHCPPLALDSFGLAFPNAAWAAELSLLIGMCVCDWVVGGILRRYPSMGRWGQ
jgi:hypothetical protein